MRLMKQTRFQLFLIVDKLPYCGVVRLLPLLRLLVTNGRGGGLPTGLGEVGVEEELAEEKKVGGVDDGAQCQVLVALLAGHAA